MEEKLQVAEIEAAEDLEADIVRIQTSHALWRDHGSMVAADELIADLVLALTHAAILKRLIQL